MNKKTIPFIIFSILIIIGCKPKPPAIIFHNSCSGYTELRALSFPTQYTLTNLDSLGFSDSLGGKDGEHSYRIDTRIVIHPEDRIWLGTLQSFFPDAEVQDGVIKGQVDIWGGINGLAFDSVQFSRKVLVLNGTGEPGLARDVSYRFNVRFGISSLEPQNADEDTNSKTMVYCSEADEPLALKLRDYIGCGQVVTRTNLKDMIIVLGSDMLSSTNGIKSPPKGISIVIKKSLFEMLVFDDGKLVKSYPIAIGRNPGDKQRRGDNRTPEGDFIVVSIENSSSWEHDFGDGKGPIPGAYGPWFIRLSTLASETRSGKLWTGIGIHGTHDTTSIGTRASEGCIRMYNHDVDSLKKIISKGTPVRIEK